jgi:hypothetical protein
VAAWESGRLERVYHRRTGRLRRVLMDVPYNRLGLPVDPRYAVAQDGGAVELMGR